MSETPTGYAHLLGTRWRNKSSGLVYRVTQINHQFGIPDIYLTAETKGGRSTWKYAPHLPFDYDKIMDDGGAKT